jgi:iron complex transport system substrate-binding protein
MKALYLFLMLHVVSFALLSAVPTVAASDYTLGIRGNANMDDTIDEKDIVYVEGIIKGINAASNLSDANNDSKIDDQDINQIKKIISGNETQLTILDTVGNIITIDMPLERIIPSRTALETMRSLKTARDRIVSVCEFSKGDTQFFQEFAELPSVGSMYDPDYEAVLKSNPDAIFLYTEESENEVKDKIKLLDPSIKVMQFAFSKPDGLPEEVEMIGYILKARENAEKFLNFWDDSVGRIEAITKNISDDGRPRVYYEYYPDFKSVGKSSGHYQKLMLSGGNNIFSELSSNAVVDSEEIIKRDPEIIIKIVGYGEYSFGGYQQENTDKSQFKAARDAIMNRPGWQNITAIKNGKVYLIHLDIMGGPGQLVGISYLAKWLHPDLFNNINPKAIHQEYLNGFQGLDYDLNKQGTFVYPSQEES